jgi:hypothetical protein
MPIHRRLAVPLLALAAMLIAGCTASATPTPTTAPVATATVVTPSKGQGAIRGRVENAQALWPGVAVYAYAAPFFPGAGGDGIYVLEPSIHPQARLDGDGTYQMSNVPPGSYVVIVGPDPSMGIAVVNQGKPAVFPIAADKVTDIGATTLSR